MTDIKDKIKTFVYNLFVRHFLPKHTILENEYMEDMSGKRYRVEACYYTRELKPLLIAIDEDGNLRSFPDNGVERVS